MSVLNSPETAVRVQRLREVLTELDLPQTHLNAVQMHGAHQPYHNWAHGVIVALNCYAAGVGEKLSAAEMRTLVLAGLYHDYDHTGNAQAADIFNVCRAISGSSFWLGVKEPTLARSEKNRIATLIAATEASHLHVPQDTLESCIMDADLLATAVPDCEAWWAALSQESGAEINLASTQVFLQARDVYTSWGWALRDEVLAQRLDLR